jgi:hypothetical protein
VGVLGTKSNSFERNSYIFDQVNRLLIESKQAASAVKWTTEECNWMKPEEHRRNRILTAVVIPGDASFEQYREIERSQAGARRRATTPFAVLEKPQFRPPVEPKSVRYGRLPPILMALALCTAIWIVLWPSHPTPPFPAPTPVPTPNLKAVRKTKRDLIRASSGAWNTINSQKLSLYKCMLN